MINKEKVEIMTRMAAYETREGKRDLMVCSYFKGDYIGFQMLKTWIGTTIAFAIMVGIYLLYQFDTIMNEIYNLDLFALGKKVLILYLAVCGVYLAASWIIYSWRYKKAARTITGFSRALDMLVGSEEEE